MMLVRLFADVTDRGGKDKVMNMPSSKLNLLSKWNLRMVYKICELILCWGWSAFLELRNLVWECECYTDCTCLWICLECSGCDQDWRDGKTEKRKNININRVRKVSYLNPRRFCILVWGGWTWFKCSIDDYAKFNVEVSVQNVSQ